MQVGRVFLLMRGMMQWGGKCRWEGDSVDDGDDAVGEGNAGREGNASGEGVSVDLGMMLDDADKNEEEERGEERERVEYQIVEDTSDSSEDDGEEDVVENDGDLDEGRDAEGEGPSNPVFNPEETYDPTFEIGMLFSNKKELKKALQSYAIKSKRTVKFTKNDKVRVYAQCGDSECGWKMHAIKIKGEETFQINLLQSHHSCPEIFEVKNMKTNWLKDKYLQKFKSDPKRCVKGFRVDIINELRVNVSKNQAYRAKKAALKEIEGSPEWQYSRLWDYAAEIRATNPGCRPIIGVDRCHLKGPHGGILLTAIGVDPNNNLFPIAYAVVNKECRETWEWFLIVLKHDLNIIRDYEFTFMSDKQKGLMQAFEEVFPGSDHRCCVRHLYNNFKHAGFRGQGFKIALWNATKACTVGEWKMRMQEMKNLSQAAHDWLVINQQCNGLGLISVREYLMRRMQENRDRCAAKWKNKLCPKIQQILQKQINKISDCMPIKADDQHYQVSCFDGSQHCVDLGGKSCSCRKWQLSGIPCKHACCAIYHQRQDPVDYVAECYSVETYKNVYAPAILPMSHEGLWSESYTIPPLPSNFGRGAGRPAKSRRRESDEPTLKNKKKRKQILKIRRHQTTIHCRICGEEDTIQPSVLKECHFKREVQLKQTVSSHMVQESSQKQNNQPFSHHLKYQLKMNFVLKHVSHKMKCILKHHQLQFTCQLVSVYEVKGVDLHVESRIFILEMKGVHELVGFLGIISTLPSKAFILFSSPGMIALALWHIGGSSHTKNLHPPLPKTKKFSKNQKFSKKTKRIQRETTKLELKNMTALSSPPSNFGMNETSFPDSFVQDFASPRPATVAIELVMVDMVEILFKQL
ncbi:UNVERIFIED_CONTAM: hypothetical protein Sradi_3959500 [Sesamum radiatum]|uniref:SWIM-type domain-containing protein n=1 Tax=Sesamum radiatum TaxID=300843 RepID=A0AAW2PHV9_SESRA